MVYIPSWWKGEDVPGLKSGEPRGVRPRMCNGEWISLSLSYKSERQAQGQRHIT